MDMKIVLLSIVKPAAGSGDGTTEYVYQLRKQLEGKAEIEVLYSLDSVKRNNVRGLIATNTVFKDKIKELAASDCDIVHITSQELGFSAKILKEGKSTAKIITTIHDLTRFEKVYHRGFVQQAYNALVTKSIIDSVIYSDGLIFDGKQTLEDTVRLMGKIPGMTRVVTLGVKENILETPVGRKRRKVFTIGYIGALATHKNVSLLLKAAKLLKGKGSFRFVIYGTGVENVSLLKYKEANGLNNVEFMGFAPEEETPRIYDSFDAFVFPSLYEGFGLPILEAQARGLPVIINENGKITPEVRRYCFKVNDEKGLAKLIVKLQKEGYLGKDKIRAMKYARSFTWEKTAEGTLNMYRKMLSR
jgi:glycosyltransferase involved in cell wall biosynthesis